MRDGFLEHWQIALLLGGKGGLEGFVDKMLAVVLFPSLYMDMDPILAV
jgi:hypothetical protein